MLLVALSLLARARPVVHTSLGSVRGNALLAADEFLGLPYGSAKRFEAAEPRATPFEEQPLEATYYGPACKQVLSSTKNYGAEYGCHVLNVWRPAGAAADAKLPVMMYIPGGSNDFGARQLDSNAASVGFDKSTDRAFESRLDRRGRALQCVGDGRAPERRHHLDQLCALRLELRNERNDVASRRPSRPRARR